MNLYLHMIYIKISLNLYGEINAVDGVQAGVILVLILQ